MYAVSKFAGLRIDCSYGPNLPLAATLHADSKVLGISVIYLYLVP